MPQADVAIVGIACRFPGDAKSPTAFHEMLLQGRDAWTKVPSSRYHVDAYRHPSRERRGTMVCEGGYFLREDVAKWDAPFFACSAVEARAMDPQQRLLLEVAYESLENAGMPLEAVANTDTACYVGGFTKDYHKIVTRDIADMPQYVMTGSSSSMLANRVSWFLNLRGPSVTADTACSSSMAALHLACETIRSETNPTRCALVGGTSLLLDPDDPCCLNALGFLSPDSRCFAFDARANGYARGEGISMLVVKHIDDAIRDGDAIRAVIRATGLNSDGRTAGIVLPNGDAQQRLIQSTYELAGLDPADTQYVELHGTGTRAGDPTEVSAVARTIAAGRPSTLYCGSVKTQIGHTEAAAAMAGVLKCVLSMEKGVIPPNLNFDTPNPRLRLDASNMVVPTAPQPWPAADVRRCSVNSFGFGGLNGHAVLDDARGYLRRRGLAAPEPEPEAGAGAGAGVDADAAPYYVFNLSAPEQDAVARQLRAHADYAQANCSPAALPSLAHTLGERRSVFQWRQAVIARSVDELLACWRDETLKPAKADASPGLALLFTGQGAQWHAMGRELLAVPVFARSVADSSACLAALGCPWDARGELTASEAESRVGDAEFSQPLCAVLQMALVDLLRHWGVKPSAVVGHSSGEIAAAYAAGALSRENCLKIAYHRGLVSEMAKQLSPGGAMMAVGLSAEEARPHLDAAEGSITLACINSPTNITLAGNRTALERLEATLKQEEVFCRLLQVQNAFHSPQMRTVADEYRRRIADVAPEGNDSSALFYSTVHGRHIATSELTADYWVANLCSPVELVSALDEMLCTNGKGRQSRRKSKPPKIIVEVGPHGALAGPLNQFKLARGGMEHLNYHSLLSRGRDASLTAMSAAAALWMKGVPINMNRVNNLDEPSRPTAVLTDLPSYCWNHSSSYWHETWSSRNRRFPPAARHDLIGSRLETYNPLEPVWRNYLRISEVPWLKDHQVHGDIVFPAAGVICAVIEAVRQLEGHGAEDGGPDISGFELREFSISQPLLIPRDEAGVEIYLSLKRRKIGMGTGAGPWLEFSFYSRQDGDMFVEHACGLVQAHHTKRANEVDGGKELQEEILAHQKRWKHTSGKCDDPVTSQAHYERCNSIGLCYGKSFQGLTKIRQNKTAVAFEATVLDSRSSMPGACESDYLVHPTTVDLMFQAMIASMRRMEGIPNQAWVPTAVNSIQVSTAIGRDPGTVLHGICDSWLCAAHEISGFIMVGDGTFDTLPGIAMEGIKISGLGTPQNPSQLSEETGVKLYAMPAWKPDLDLLQGPRLPMLASGRPEKDPLDMAQFCSDSRDIVDEMCRLALGQLDSSNPLPPHLQKYVEWMRMRSRVTTYSSITPPDSPLEAYPSSKEDHVGRIEKLGSFIEKYPVDGGLLRHVFTSLNAIFARETVPIASLMANENFSKFYKESHGLQVHNQVFRNWFDLKAHKKPSLRVIEIGAGTASTTVPVLEQLGEEEGITPRFSQWTFTDISPGWFENAKTLLSNWKSRVEYKVLNIENDPVEQGFEAESYDVVLAVNVLHATKNIETTLANCRRLLKPGGNLVIGEYTNPDDMLSFIFGTLPGWWAAEDGRKHGPLLNEPDWDKALKASGFSGTDIAMSDGDDMAGPHRMSTMVSTKPHEEAVASSKDVVVVMPDDNTDFTAALASSVCRELQRLGARAAIKDLASAIADMEDKTVISLLEYEKPFLEGAEEADFEQVKHLLLHSGELLWVTRSDSADRSGHPSKRIVSGLLRCLKAEDASRRYHELHFCRELASGIDSASSTLVRRLSSIWHDEKDDVGEMETVERDGAFCISRYMPENDMNRSLARTTESDPVPQMANLVQPGRPLQLKIGRPGMLDTLHFVDDEAPSQPLLDDEVEIEVRACALNFRDILVAVGEIRCPDLGYEAAGIVRRVGSKVTRLSPGHRVVCMRPGVMRTCLRTHESTVHILPESMSLEEGVTIPVAYATAYRCLVEVARLQKGESVLIHAAAGGFGQAATQLAKMLGAEIFCTVSTEAKKQTMVSLGVRPDHIFSSRDLSFEKGIKRVTEGRGVDVVVNSLAGEALRKSWACLAPYGRFIEVGKKDILGNTGLDMEPFMNNTVFACVNVDGMVSEPQRSWELVNNAMKLFEQGSIGLIQPIAVHDFSDVETVFREMQRGTHIGKLVLRITPESRVQVAPRKLIPLRLEPDVTYLLVGGLGGLGRAQALFMAEHGARHVAFISRSGSAKEEAQDLLAKLAAAGVDARAYAGDVADKDGLRAILADISRSMPPVRGVIQGAMVLEDCLFHKMNYQQWVAATRPKIQGSWNLHELLPDNLDFFVVLSSIAGIVGSASQANYAAGNTYQDALVHYRHSKGLPAQSLDLGVMKGVGYVAEHEAVAARMKMFGLATVNEQQFYHLLRCALTGTADGESPLTRQLLVGAGSGGIMQASQAVMPEADFYWLSNLSPFAYLQQLDVRVVAEAASEDKTDSARLFDRLKQSKTMDEACEIVQDMLLARIAKIITVPVADIDTAKPVHAYGVDSLVAVELRNWLSKQLRSDVSIFDLTGSAPISTLSKKIANRSHLVSTAAKGQGNEAS